jgi:hypothetical protein
MTTQLRVYNAALAHLGERRLTSTSEARDHRYHLDDSYTEVKARCLESGMWNFAMRAVTIDASVLITPEFGFDHAFEKPSDWVRTYIASATEDLAEWLNRFNDEAAVWYADVDPIYVKYVSNSGSAYCCDLKVWPQSFADYVAIELAIAVAPTISSSSGEKLEILERYRKRIRSTAMTKDAANEAPVFPPTGSWTRSRTGDNFRGPVPAYGRTIP